MFLARGQNDSRAAMNDDRFFVLNIHRCINLLYNIWLPRFPSWKSFVFFAKTCYLSRANFHANYLLYFFKLKNIWKNFCVSCSWEETTDIALTFHKCFIQCWVHGFFLINRKTTTVKQMHTWKLTDYRVFCRVKCDNVVVENGFHLQGLIYTWFRTSWLTERGWLRQHLHLVSQPWWGCDLRQYKSDF